MRRNSKKKVCKKNSVPVHGPLYKPCGFECRRASLNFLRSFFVANCNDLLHIIVRQTRLCSSRGILKTNSGREGVKICKLFYARSLSGHKRKKGYTFMTPSLILGGGGGDSTPLSSTPWNVAASKKRQLGRRQQDGSCEQAATANIIFRLAAVENSHLACLRSMGRPVLGSRAAN